MTEAVVTKRNRGRPRKIQLTTESTPVAGAVQAAITKIDANDPETQKLLAAIAHREKFAKIQLLFPTKGKFRRSLYKKHLTHFAAGCKYNQRLFMAGNRIGKTTTAGTN